MSIVESPMLLRVAIVCAFVVGAASAVAATFSSSVPATGVSICSPATDASSAMDRTTC